MAKKPATKKGGKVKYSRPYEALKIQHDVLTAMEIHGIDVTTTQYKQLAKDKGLTSLEIVSEFFGGFVAARRRVSQLAGLYA